MWVAKFLVIFINDGHCKLKLCGAKLGRKSGQVGVKRLIGLAGAFERSLSFVFNIFKSLTCFYIRFIRTLLTLVWRVSGSF